jgi:hypothetical protein
MHVLSRILPACVAAVLAAHAARASVVWDYSPDTTHGSLGNASLTSEFGGQNFLEWVYFSQATTLTGMDIYSSSAYGALGEDATAAIYSYDNSGAPHSLLDLVTMPIDAIDGQGTASIPSLDRKHMDFGRPIVLQAGAYWVGMSGAGGDLTQASLMGVQNDSMAQMNGTQFVGYTYVGDMAFRLDDGDTTDGDPTDVPEPASLGLLAGAALLVGAAATRRHGRENRTV